MFMARAPLVLALLLSLVGLAGCSWTNEGGVTGRYESREEFLREASTPWNGEPISVYNEHGSVQVVGVPGRTTIAVRSRFVAGADSQEDADAAFADSAEQVVLERNVDTWSVSCPGAAAWHGSVDPESTGCSSLRVEVPAGTADVPLKLSVRAVFGGVHVSGASVASLTVTAPFGIVADVTPVQGAVIDLHGEDLISGLCSTVLRVPPASSIVTARLDVQHADVRYAGVDPEDPTFQNGVYIQGFEDAPALAPRTPSTTWKRGGDPFDATSITLRASLGKAVLTTLPVEPYDPFSQCYDRELHFTAGAETP